MSHVIVIALRLSQWIAVGSHCSRPISLSSLRIQVNCFTACVKAMYSASVVDRATVLCFFELHMRQAPFMMHAYPDMDLVSARLAKSASA